MRGDSFEGTFEGTKVPLKNGGPNSIRGNTQVSYIITQANNIYQHILKSRFMYLFYPIIYAIYLFV